MAGYVKVPESDWISILDSVRAKTGKPEKLLSGEVPADIAGINTGGGIVDSGEYVRVKNGDEFYYEMGNSDSVSGDVSQTMETLAVDMTGWAKNSSASEAYQSILYNPATNENICRYIGVDGHEVIGFQMLLEANKTYEFSLDYFTPSDIVGEYESPHAPFIGIVSTSALNYSDNPYSTSRYSKYATTVMQTGATEDYVHYSCQYTPTVAHYVLFCFATGCTLDGVAVEFRLKNIEVKRSV